MVMLATGCAFLSRFLMTSQNLLLSLELEELIKVLDFLVYNYFFSVSAFCYTFSSVCSVLFCLVEVLISCII